METGGVTYETESGMNAGSNSLQQLLANNIGKYVICELLIGLRSMTVREGVLAEVGRDYFVLSSPNSGNLTSCDLYSLKFVTLPTSAQGNAQTGGYHPYQPMCGNTCNASSGTNACWIRVD